MFNFVCRDIDFAHKLDSLPVEAPDFAKHYHDFCELFFFISGSTTYTVEEENHDLSPGDALLIQPGEHHFVTFRDRSPYERYVLKFPEEMLPEHIRDKVADRSAFFLGARAVQPIIERLDTYCEEYSGEDLYVLCKNLVAEIVIALCRALPDAKPLVADNKITPILQYINQNLCLPLTIHDLCEKFFFSQSYICKEFRAYMKIPIMKYIRTKKIMAAHKKIMQGEKPTKIAEMYGYADYSTFYRSYLSVMGFPPSNLKEKPKE